MMAVGEVAGATEEGRRAKLFLPHCGGDGRR